MRWGLARRAVLGYQTTIMVKSIFQSKTIGVNIIALGVALFQHFNGPILAADPQWFALALAAINISLRFMTTQPVAL